MKLKTGSGGPKTARSAVMHTGWSKKTVPQFYFCDNFRKCTTIFTIFSLLEQEIHAA